METFTDEKCAGNVSMPCISKDHTLTSTYFFILNGNGNSFYINLLLSHFCLAHTTSLPPNKYTSGQ